MINVTDEILNTIEDRDLKLSQVAKEIGASKQTMSKLKTKGAIGFRYLLKISYLLFPENPEEKMSEWCLNLNTVESIKQSFEYAAITRNVNLLSDLIELHTKEEGILGEYVNVYNLIYKYMLNEINYKVLGYELEKVNPKDSALPILLLIYKCYQCYFTSNFLLVLELASEAERKLNELSEKRELFIKQCYLHRLSEILAPINLHLNNLESARYYASIIINADICAKTKSDAYYTMGMSYLLNDEELCLRYMQESYDIMSIVGDSNLAEESGLNLDFVKVYLNKNLTETSHPSVVALKQLKNGERSFQEIEEVLYQGADEDFIVFYKATSKKSVDSLYDCHEYFFNKHNLYFASITAHELLKSGENSRAIKNLLNYKIKKKGDVHFEKRFIDCFSRYSINSRGVCLQ